MSIELYCNEHLKQDLEIDDVDGRRGDASIYVISCPVCLEEAIEKATNEGRD